MDKTLSAQEIGTILCVDVGNAMPVAQNFYRLVKFR